MGGKPKMHIDNKDRGTKANSNIVICTGKHLALKQINSFLIIKPGFFIDPGFSAWSELLRQLQTKVFSYHLRSDGKLVYKYLAVFSVKPIKKNTVYCPSC